MKRKNNPELTLQLPAQPDACETTPPKMQRKNKPVLKLDLPPPLDIKNRKAALCIVSKMINGQEYKTKVKAFSLSKLWSSREPKPFPSTSEEINTLLEKEASDGMDVVNDVNQIMKFHCPLLASLASQDTVDRRWLAWVNFKRRIILSLGSDAWENYIEKLAAAELGIPVFLNGVGERLQTACFRDNEVINRLQELTRSCVCTVTPEYNRACTERRINVMEINRCLSLVQLLCFFLEVGQWKDLKVARGFLAKIGDREALECHCQVLDVDALTSRSIVLGGENERTKLEYVLDDSELTPLETNQNEEEDERAWWNWVEKWIRDFHCRGVACQTRDFDQLDRIVKRIDGCGLKTSGVIQALSDWRQSCAEKNNVKQTTVV